MSNQSNSMDVSSNVAASSNLTYFKEIPPTQEQAGDTAYVIHAVAKVTLDMYEDTTIDGDTILVKQVNNTTDIQVSPNDNKRPGMLKLRLIGINAPEISHIITNDKGEKVKAYKTSNNIWTPIDELTGQDKEDYEKQASTYEKGDRARDWLLERLGINLSSLNAKTITEATSQEIVVVIDKLQANKTNDTVSNGSVIVTPGTDVYNRYLSCIYVKNPVNGDWININKSLLLQDFGVTPFRFADKNGASHMSPVFKIEDYQSLYVVANGGEDNTATDKAGTYSSDVKDDRLDSAISLGFLKAGFEEWTTVIGDTVLFIPPTGIQVTKSTNAERVKVARSKTSIEKGTGHTDFEIRMTLFFDGPEMINGYKYNETLPDGENVTYYMHGLRQIISQFRKTPFLPIINHYLNFSYNIEAVTLSNLTIGTVDGVPGLIKAELIMTDFEPRTYILGLDATQNMGQLIHWPLFRYYYQKSFSAEEENYGHTYLAPVPDKLNGDVKFSVIKQSDLEQLSQEANIIALNKVKDGTSTQGKSVDEVLLSYNMPKAVKDNYEAYMKAIDVYKSFLAFYNTKSSSKKSNVSSLVKEFGNGMLHMSPKGLGPVISVAIQYPFMYLKEGTDYYLAQNYYKSMGMFWPSDVENNFTVKFTNTNDFYLHKDFGVPALAGRVINRIDDPDTKADKHSFIYGLWLTANGIEDMFISKAGEKPTVMAPDVCIFNFRFGELAVDSFLSTEERMIHNEFIGYANDEAEKTSQRPKEKFTDVINRIISKNADYDNLYKKTKALIDADNEAARNQSNIDKLQSQNWLDDLNLSFEAVDIPFSPAAINIGFANTFAYTQVLNFNTPSKQYMGGTDTVIQLDYIVEGQEAIKKFNYIYDYTTYIVRHYRSYISDGFIKIENELVNMAGVKYVVINSVDVKEVPDFPDVYTVRLTLASFDRTQRNKEELKKLASAQPEYLGTDQNKVNSGTNATYQALIDSLKNAEVYPDLELPTNDELSGKGFYIVPNGGKYPDPDFYLSYDGMSMISSVIKDNIVEKNDLGKIFAFDANTGHTIQANANAPLGDITPGESMSAAVSKASKQLDDKQKSVQSQIDSTSSATGTNDKIVAEAGQIASGEPIGGDSFYPGGTVSTAGLTVGLANSNSELSGNLAKLMNRFNVPGGVDSECNQYSNREVSKTEAHEKIDHFCDKYGIDKDPVIRGLIHTLVEGLSNASHWSKYDLANKVPKGSNLDLEPGGDNSNAIDVGIMKLDFKGSNYSSSDMRDLLWNPVANIQFGIKKLIENYQKTFSGIGGNRYGIYSKYETSGKSKDAVTDLAYQGGLDPSVVDAWSRVFGGTTQAAARASAKFLTNAISDTNNTIYSKQWWLTGKGHSDKACRAFYIDPRYSSIVKNVIDKNPTSSDKDSLLDAIKALISDLQGFGDGDSSKSRIVSISGADIVLSANSTSEFSNGAKYDKFFERGRWLAACLMFFCPSGELDYNKFNAVKQFLENKFNPIAIQGVSADYRENVVSFLSKIPTNSYTQQLITCSSSESQAFKSIDEKGENYFGDFNGDPQFCISDNDIFKSSLYDATHFDRRGRLCRAFPTFFVCLVDEGNKLFNWRLHDNFYGYSAINDIQVMRSRKMAADTCVIQMSNMFQAFWNWDDDSMYKRQSSFVDVMNSIFDTEEYVKDAGAKTRNADVNKSMLKPGARLHVRLGYSANVRDLPIMFNGTITEIEQGEVIQIVAQGDGIELCNKIPASPRDTTENNKATDGDVDILTRFIKYVTGQTSEPRNVIVDMFHTKGGFWKDLIYSAYNGVFFNSNPLGIVHFGNPEFKAIFNEGGEVSQNVYAALNPISVDTNGARKEIIPFEDSANIFSKKDEVNFSMYLYNKTPWDVIQVCRSLVPDFIASVEPFEFRSTLFFGKPYYPFAYQYDYSTLDTEKLASLLSNVITQSKAEDEKLAVTDPPNIKTNTDTPCSSNADIIWRFLKSKGLSDAGAAGIIGNIQQESTFDPTEVNEIGASGLCQWLNDRLVNLKNFASQKGKIWQNVDVQLEFMYKEMSEMGGGFLDSFKTATDPRAAADLFESKFERSGGSAISKREQYAMSAFSTYSGTGGVYTASSTAADTQMQRVAVAVAKYSEINMSAPLREMRKSFQQTHIMTSHFDIIDNKIKASSKGVYTNVIGTFTGQGALQKKGSYQTPVIYADTDIWNEKQKTSLVDCQYYAKGVPLFGLIPGVNWMKNYFVDQSKAINIATSALIDYMKDMYQGEMVVMGYPAIKPYDMMYVFDEYNQMNGLCEVQQVVQHFSVEDGYTTSITPDACVTAHDQIVKNKWTLANGLAPVGFWVAGKVSAAILGMKLFGFTRFGVGFAGKVVNIGLSGASKAKSWFPAAKTEADIAEEIASTAEKVEEVGDKLKGSTMTEKGFAKLKDITGKKLEALKGLASKISSADGDLSKVIDAAAKHGKDFSKAAEAGVVAANIAELAILYVAERSLITWVKRFIRNRQAVSMTLLRQHGKELSAGINGHRGLVVGDTPGIMDSVIKGMMDSTLATIVLGDDPKTIANTIYTRSTSDVGVIDPSYQEQYTDEYIKDSQDALQEMSAMMGSNFQDSNWQVGAFIDGSIKPITNIAIVDYAMDFLGKPYVWGAKGPDSFDCSGLMQYVYAHFGVHIGAGTASQQYIGNEVSDSNMKPGDLIFFGDSKTNTTHVSMYIGGNKMIEAPHTGDVVKISPVRAHCMVRHVADLDSSGRPIKMPWMANS